MNRIVALLTILLCLGCVSTRGVERDVAAVLDGWQPPAAVDGPPASVPPEYANIVSTFPLPWPDLHAAAEAERLTASAGLEPVVDALEREFRESNYPRNLRALCLIALVDRSDRWLQLWHGTNRE